MGIDFSYSAFGRNSIRSVYPSEVGSFACVYALIVGFFIYKKLNFKRLIETLKEAVVDVGAIMFMISMSGIFGYGIPFDKVPQKITAFITGITTQPLVVMAIIIVVLLLFGMFMEALLSYFF